VVDPRSADSNAAGRKISLSSDALNALIERQPA
jgi:hypothetical protein